MSVRRKFSGERLRERRKQAKLNRDVLAFAVGRTVGSIANYERGITTPSAEVLALFAEYLDCTPDDFFIEEESQVA
jgi:transcriptional regulator with XRE-family HTH domain